MKYRILGSTGLAVSRIGLGTAEIGFQYGIGNRALPTEEDAINLLKKAVDLGINYFDTANFYGDAEDRIRKSRILSDWQVIVATKCGQFLEKGEDPRGVELESRLRENIETSLRRLGIDCVPILMLHGGSKEQIERGELIAILKKFQKEGKARFLGISTRGEEALLAAIKGDAFNVIQVAYSILDQRMAKNVLRLAFRDNFGVVGRSALLKGVLTELVNLLPEKLSWLKNNSRKASLIAEEVGCDLPVLALRFVDSEKRIATIVVGTNKIANLERAVGAINNYLPADIVERLKKLAIDDPFQVDPSRWPKL